jgi:hypothetical protein
MYKIFANITVTINIIIIVIMVIIYFKYTTIIFEINNGKNKNKINLNKIRSMTEKKIDNYTKLVVETVESMMFFDMLKKFYPDSIITNDRIKILLSKIYFGIEIENLNIANEKIQNTINYLTKKISSIYVLMEQIDPNINEIIGKTDTKLKINIYCETNFIVYLMYVIKKTYSMYWNLYLKNLLQKKKTVIYNFPDFQLIIFNNKIKPKNAIIMYENENENENENEINYDKINKNYDCVINIKGFTVYSELYDLILSKNEIIDMDNIIRQLHLFFYNYIDKNRKIKITTVGNSSIISKLIEDKYCDKIENIEGKQKDDINIVNMHDILNKKTKIINKAKLINNISGIDLYCI